MAKNVALIGAGIATAPLVILMVSCSPPHPNRRLKRFACPRTELDELERRARELAREALRAYDEQKAKDQANA